MKRMPVWIALYLYLKNLLKIFTLEVELAKKSTVTIMMYVGLLIVLGLSAWLLTLVIFVFMIHKIVPDWVFSLSVVSLINFVIIALTLWRIHFHAERLKFKYTRKHLSSAKTGEANGHVIARTADSKVG